MLLTGLLLAPLVLAAASMTPAPDRLPALAEDLERALTGAKVRTPDGAATGVLGTALDRERIAASLATISEPGGVARLVGSSCRTSVSIGTSSSASGSTSRERLSRRRRSSPPRGASGTTTPSTRPIARRRGKSPRARGRGASSCTRSRSGSSRPTSTSFRRAPNGRGSSRCSRKDRYSARRRASNLGDARHHTLALVLVRPRFVPSTCADEGEIARGHEDEGEVLLVLAGEKSLEGRLDVSDRFVPEGGGAPRVPRYPCREGDAAEVSSPIADRFRDRATLPLLLFDEKATKGEGILVEARRRATDRKEERVRLARIVTGDGGARLLEERGSGPGEPHGHRHHHGHGDHDDATVTHRFEGPEEWAKRFDDPSRDAWQKPLDVLRLLSVREGMAVGDLGAGTGYFSIPLGRAVGPKGTVWGIDIEPGMVDYLDARARREGLPNVKGVLTKPDEPGLAPESADLVLVVNTWHHIDDRIDYLGKLRKTLRPGGRVAVVDYKIGDLPVGPPADHKLPPEKVVGEFAAGGFEVVLRDETTLPYQYVLAFAPR
jgi:Methylase involved in ubiquinone/menaquinone biosynthesis